jgi:hypothetical protein
MFKNIYANDKIIDKIAESTSALFIMYFTIRTFAIKKTVKHNYN